MAMLDQHIAPDEAVLWRTPDLRGWALDNGKTLAWTAGIFIVVAFLPLGSEFAGDVLIFPLMVLVLVLGYVARTLLRGPVEALLTARQLLFQRRIRRPEIKFLARRDIVRLEIFGGDDVLVLHGRHGELHRATLLGDALDLARKLDLRLILWTPYEPPKRTRRIEFALMVLRLFATLGFTIALVLMLPDAYFEAIRANLAESAKPLAAGATILAAGASSWLAAGALFGVARRLVLRREELNRLRRAKFSPLWRGRDPRAARKDSILARGRRIIDRALYGRFPDFADPEPEIFEPGAFPPPEGDDK